MLLMTKLTKQLLKSMRESLTKGVYKMKKNYLNPMIYVTSLNKDDVLIASNPDKGIIFDGQSDFAEQDYFDLPFNN